MLAAACVVACNEPSDVDRLASACSGGHANACGQLADKYRSGTGVSRDSARAFGLYEQACRGGDYGGCLSAALAHARGDGTPRDTARAIAMLDEQCTAKQSISCYELGRLYEHPTEGSPDLAAAAERYRRACEPGPYYPACYRLGEMYEKGLGVPQNDRAAADYYLKSCGTSATCDAFARIEQLYTSACNHADTAACQAAAAFRAAHPEVTR